MIIKQFIIAQRDKTISGIDMPWWYKRFKIFSSKNFGDTTMSIIKDVNSLNEYKKEYIDKIIDSEIDENQKNIYKETFKDVYGEITKYFERVSYIENWWDISYENNDLLFSKVKLTIEKIIKELSERWISNNYFLWDLYNEDVKNFFINDTNLVKLNSQLENLLFFIKKYNKNFRELIELISSCKDYEDFYFNCFKYELYLNDKKFDTNNEIEKIISDFLINEAGFSHSKIWDTIYLNDYVYFIKDDFLDFLDKLWEEYYLKWNRYYSQPSKSQWLYIRSRWDNKYILVKQKEIMNNIWL